MPFKIYFDKLVRGKTVATFSKEGAFSNYQKLTGKKLINSLKDKLVEEALEVKSAVDKNELIEEMADVMQVIIDMCSTCNINQKDIENSRKEKLGRKGGFEDGIFMESITVKTNNHLVEYCRKQKDKYKIEEYYDHA